MKTLSVRRLNVNDLDDFRRVRLEALRLHPDAFGASYEDWNKKPTQFFAERLLGDCVFGGFDLQNTLQGIIGVSCSAAPKLSHIATIWGMYVRAEMRGSGLSRALLAAALEAAKSARTIKLSVVTTNHAAQALYRSFGFTEWATDTAALFVNGVFHDECLMRRESESDL
ncbi:GNAT family N-acetyltransferase [Hafnia psychrotolerans]|uniref:N-acetyltransferase n=1 Tax=Hafnia psychrotolerans TaxID=1477018 RepID=A0ABQ1FVB6_9GAMM|nr:GNAT family N-acetyltransferase [Hafnia psychrotolerans]GGA31800.1 N-acetyltransferase [Hafnia psychrotolerans]